ncbi:hypothetical protein A3I46_03900 [Candidatus Kaiserbacteria bacterium RIFCSPLOWO2_02_FULL_54_13]|uniref:Uncharacterized protein n=1 Tax=Candidatus Kaiserbacteria bacterium RIFCSPHIGHO2_02_FULL_54_22 TaxID=1798495 RepID=A0A1F6DL00_9BACT|nr:MAG: hypothetical protein A3C19_01480 [Candidatus Kaiserbacteria bacterium RIFCSPHIGHO2_02_FULL_54_22]OGG67828.1 MAG: hypothetical protein A3E99_01550 [Candidatus Kaiserbacteria bacterium RIFCSPHIGHO2_12_FULL_54_16]OGG82431.1 MAG: hypothetical protein A3I46_03900 [Candidatus Kaiserbacteria bacterium RIFCSPLOWO2_02_FULL_54_13]OGG90460.1 MAG: hypothetical protein A3G12_01205 [Candidatus Kaiserbacteria bacterium RIFCSPLOWO2_12_FULL_54_10]
MGADIHKEYIIRCYIYFSVDSTNISGHIDTSVVSIFPMQFMVIKSFVMNIFIKNLQLDIELILYLAR